VPRGDIYEFGKMAIYDARKRDASRVPPGFLNVALTRYEYALVEGVS